MAFTKPPNDRSRGRQQQRRPVQQAQQHCFFCVHQIAEPDYRDTQLLGRFVSSYKKIAPRRRSGVCAKHQRRLSTAIKRARQMALMPYIPE
ncbi:MAG: 30S ribosomal protein S18 [bacterium]|nr:30S ribosomal protein S18 [bacterium]